MRPNGLIVGGTGLAFHAPYEDVQTMEVLVEPRRPALRRLGWRRLLSGAGGAQTAGIGHSSQNRTISSTIGPTEDTKLVLHDDHRETLQCRQHCPRDTWSPLVQWATISRSSSARTAPSPSSTKRTMDVGYRPFNA